VAERTAHNRLVAGSNPAGPISVWSPNLRLLFGRKFLFPCEVELSKL
jgi:hypothetical protein